MKNPLRNGVVTLFAVGFMAVAMPAQAQLSVTVTDNPTTLANEILGSGITILNEVYQGAMGSAGIFTGGVSAGIGMENGILLTTGKAVDAIGPNESDNTSFDNPNLTDADLDSIASSSTNDEAILEFDFTSDGGDLFFEYVFASEEYNEFTNSSFNDVFGFFLDGVNIALIPGTTTPVSINTVNGGNPFGTNASNPDLFNNNDLSDGGPFFNLEYDGFTDVFTASAIGLAPGTHHIKLAIADVNDSIYDSGVFIKASSFSDTPPPDDDMPMDPPPTNVVPEPATMLLFGGGLLGAALRKRKQA